jgi:hypothetical protein
VQLDEFHRVSVAAKLPRERAGGKAQPWHRDRLAVVYAFAELKAIMNIPCS